MDWIVCLKLYKKKVFKNTQALECWQALHGFKFGSAKFESLSWKIKILFLGFAS